MIYCIGNSQAVIFSGNPQADYQTWPHRRANLLSGLCVFHLGPALAYNLCVEGHWSRTALFKVLATEVPPGANVLLVFGEIDCRAHLLKQAAIQKRSRASVTAECVLRYGHVLAEVRDAGYRVHAWGVIPSARNGVHKDVTTSCQDRNGVTRMFNRLLSAHCYSLGIGFLSIFGDLITPDGLNRTEFYSDGMHLGVQALPLIQQALESVEGGK